MDIDRRSTLGDLAAAIPGALRVFDELHIDYCCAGRRSLGEACTLRGLDAEKVLARIEEAAARPPDPDDGWRDRGLRDLVDHIVERHHGFTRREVARLRGLAAELLESDAKPKGASDLYRLIVDLEDDIVPHMVKEERILFPYVVELEARARTGNQRPHAPFGPVANPIRGMMWEHHHADDQLRALRAACNDYVAPDGAPPALRALYEGLAALERDLHHHVHLESNILFRRAIDLERA